MQSFYQKFISCLLLLSAANFGFIAASLNFYEKDGKRYIVETDLKYNYLQAIDECSRRDFQLVIIDSIEKNAVIMDLLQALPEKPRFIWLDHHDEFNKEINLNRSFYSISTGQRNTFGYWAINEPSNRDAKEHCVEMLVNSDYKWNDINCDAPLHGLICEEHHLATAHKTDLDGRRYLTNVTHTNTINYFETQRKLIQEINIKTRETTNWLMSKWSKTVEEINKKDLPAEDQQRAFGKITQETLESMDDALLSSENEINIILAFHAKRLEEDLKFIDGVLKNHEIEPIFVVV